MADYGKGMIMGRSSCDWVHARLPLLVDDGDGLACEDNDLDTEDRRLIKDHLTHCPRCQQRQTDLKKAFTVLSIAAAEMAGLRSPSLWPRLEERIQRHRLPYRSTWLRCWRAICPEAVQISTDRAFQGWDQLCSNLPLQLAWIRDSFSNFLVDRSLPFYPRQRDWTKRAVGALTPRVAFVFSIAAVVILLLSLSGRLHHSQTLAEAQVAPQETSPPAPQFALPELADVSEDVVTATSSATVSRASNSLSLATSPTPTSATSMGQVATAKTVSKVTTSPTDTTASTPRYDFDLEQGTPMPPETRTSKPAY